ncbi:urea ABC transporter [Methylobacterium sp. Leaf465]|uniref:ABC transporter permease subunit n=1 Tax=unclassified Methylobacterium TaxID=2615210 RepID=UPI0006FDB0D1|nr:MULTISPECIES: urea ABC transporter [unclassified Methylobacterium]KQO71612.1 urea ABC transporter [Methylobacterium sp. Leaf89]KQT79701.1 urea ABC transporter [Methylobacterium sp. Leaf465]KQU16421.1 urea ABC transporter [Methylobacterium sp. Leaf94]
MTRPPSPLRALVRPAALSFLAMVASGLVILFGAPHLLDTFGLVQMTGFVAMAMFALSQGFIWGYGGVMSFGQAAFLGLGGYAYAVAVLNLGDSTLPVLLAIVVPMLFAGLLGYFMFYGRISDAYIGVITLTVSVILFQLVNTTSGSQYRIGEAELGGFNGIPAIPALNLPGDAGNPLDPEGIWYAAMGSLILVYVVLRAILASRFGRVVVAIRENETRAQLIGYDPRLYKLLAFMISAGIAGLGGCLFANWGGFISPTVFGLTMSAQVIIFVLVGGLGTLLGPILGAVLIQWLTIEAGAQSLIDSNLGLGAILVTFVLLIPQGLVPVARNLFLRLGTALIGRRMRAKPLGPAPGAALAGEVRR